VKRKTHKVFVGQGILTT